MIKHKNKDAAKRREAKKHRKAVKRKAQVRTVSLRNAEIDYPIEYLGPKLSATIIDYAEPLKDDIGVEEAIRMSIILWNVSLFEKPEALELIGPILDELADKDPVAMEELNDIFEMMYERKQRYFSYENRPVADYIIVNNGEQLNLQVLSHVN